MSKRGFVAFESASPELASFKRRRMAAPAAGGLPGSGELFSGGAFNPHAVLAPAQQLHAPQQLQLQQHNQLQHVNLHQGKRRRAGSGDFAQQAQHQQAGEASELRGELERVKTEATARVSQLELVGRNLHKACEEQASELGQVHKENKLLKRSVLVLNERREEAERQAGESKRVAEDLARRVAELERANMELLMRQHNGSGALPCRQDGWDGDSGGNGQVF